MSDIISRQDAIEAVKSLPNTPNGYSDTYDKAVFIEILEELPSAEAVSMEEHIKELNDLAVEWKAKFAKAEKITDEIYDETMAKVAKECEECKERLRNSADAKPTVIRSRTFMPTKDFNEWAKRIKEVNPNAVVIPCDAEVASAEAVHGEWVRKYDDKVNCYWYECDQCGEYRPRNQFGHEYNANFCPNCGAKMHKGGEDE